MVGEPRRGVFNAAGLPSIAEGYQRQPAHRTRAPFRSISRAELARQSGLSAPTVSTIVDQLLERGILVEVATAPSNGGRPPVLLSIDPKAGYVIGIKLRGDGLTTVVCDLDAEVIASRRRRFRWSAILRPRTRRSSRRPEGRCGPPASLDRRS